MSSTPQTAVVQALEVAAVAGAAAEVRREPRVAAVDEVLRDAVPLVGRRVGRPAVRVDDRGDGRVGRRAGGPEQEAVDLEPVERPVRDLFRASTCGAARTAAGVGASSTVRAPSSAASMRSMRGAVAWSS